METETGENEKEETKEDTEQKDPKNYKDFLESAVERKKFKTKIKEYCVKHRIALIIIGSVILMAAILTFLGFHFLLRGGKAIETTNTLVSDNTAATPAAPILYEAPLDGVKTDQASATRHPLAVMIENHPDARPQSGLDKASIVYEAIAEGGITRFMAVYGTNLPDKAGPVRSARTYFVDWAEGYNAYLAHVGGNIDALDKIKADKVQDLDEFKFSECSAVYCRDLSNKKLATEHTMYGYPQALLDAAAKFSYSSANNFTLYKFKDDPTSDEAAALPVSQKITVNFSSPTYKVEYNYDQATNSYKRFLAGVAQLDKITKVQLNPKNVIVMTVKRQEIKTRINEEGYNMTTIGTGPAEIFIDGKDIKGTWKKTSSTARETFYDATGAEITFNRGQTWISVIPPETTSSVTVQ
ncbi:MAG: DUF3048 domain-containing protein [Candidatus Berkelbacteria bacterium]|nr:DUF3048 domain-containing protein [Candidatus Berkelbacteria bacterium]